MPMPRNLVFVRHGESEGNIANRASRNGDHSHFTPEFTNRHSSHWRLSDRGKEQARWAGEYLRSTCSRFGRRYVSPYIRAMETMALLGIGGPSVFVSYELRERSWGELDMMSHEERVKRFGPVLARRDKDPYLWEPTGGEPLVTVQTRVRDFMSTLWRECGDINVLCVCHAEVIEVARVVLERKLPRDYIAMRADKREDIWNCSILHYTRKDPAAEGSEKGVLSDHLDWVRLVTPPDAQEKGVTGFDWRRIDRPAFTDEKLLEYVEFYPRVVPG